MWINLREELKDTFQTLPQEEQEAVLAAVREAKMQTQPVIIKPSLQTVSMTELYDMTFPPRTPVIEGLLCSGTYLFAGAPKIGKSFLMAQIGYHVATGTPLWGYPVTKGDVLYLALEDDYGRLQGRLNLMFGVESVDGLHFAVQSRTIAEGLNTQMEEFVQLHQNTKLIIIDTLQKVREIGSESYSYAMDYATIANLKSFSDAHNLAIILVHHTRKMEASDHMDKISGTNGLSGSSDGSFLLERKKRTEPTATLELSSRDLPGQELTLEFDQERCIWNLTKAAKPLVRREPEEIIKKVGVFMLDKTVWTGTASELLEAMQETKILPQNLSRKLNVNVSVLYNEFNIYYKRNERSADRRSFSLIAVPKEDVKPETEINDDVTLNDDDSMGGQEASERHEAELDNPADVKENGNPTL